MEIIRSASFDKWLRGVRDKQAKARVLARVRRLGLGNPGDVRPIGQGLSELRIAYGPGYRVYYLQHGSIIIVLLCGGDKSTQSADIAKAKTVAKAWRQSQQES